MIYFVSTFPPIICGIGDYTKCVVSELPEGSWRVISPRISEFASSEALCDNHVSYTISLSNPHLPGSLNGELVWFQHAFGMWGEPSLPFYKLIAEARERKCKIVATLQALHFQSPETPYGLDEREYQLLKEVLPFLDAMPVFCDGTRKAVIRAFPDYKKKLSVLRHGVQIYPAKISQDKAKKKFLGYLINHANISDAQKQEIRSSYDLFFSEKTVLVGNFGFITRDRDPFSVFRFRERLQVELPKHKVIAIYVGIIQKRADKPRAETLPLLNELNSVHDGTSNFFYENYIPDEILPFAFRALDFTLIWYEKATQSGRMAFAQGTGTCVVGRDIEGVGETLGLSGLPAANTIDELAEKAKRLVLEPKLGEEIQRKSLDYAHRFSFDVQAQKHLLIEQAVCSGNGIPVLDQLSLKKHNLR